MGIFFSSAVKGDDMEMASESKSQEAPTGAEEEEYTLMSLPSGVIIVDCKVPPVILPDDPTIPLGKLYVETNIGLIDYDEIIRSVTNGKG